MIAEHASPSASVGARPSKAFAVGLLAGIVAGLGVIFGLDAFDRSLKTVDQTEAILGLPVLAAVPESKEKGSSDGDDDGNGPPKTFSSRLVAEAPKGNGAEAFQTPRAPLVLLGREAGRRFFFFTGAAPAE